MECFDVMTKLLSSYMDASSSEGLKAIDFPSFTDWDKLHKYSRLHSCSGMLYAGLREVDGVPNDVLRLFQLDFYKSLELSTHIDEEAASLSQVLSKHKIDHMFFKGHVIKNYYPDPELRTMGDVDVMVRGIEKDELSRVLMEEGYENFSEYYSVCSFMKNKVHFDLHYASFDSSKLAKTEFSKRMNSEWDNCNKTDSEHVFCLDKTYHFIYMLCHFYKHFVFAGCGIRYFLDFPLFVEKELNNLDWIRINNAVKELRLGKVVSVIEYVSSRYLNKDVFQKLDIDKLEVTNEAEELLKNYILNAGVHGTNKMHIRAKSLSENEKVNNTSITKMDSLRHMLHLIFPPVKVLAKQWPMLKKHKYLLPIMWFVRIFRILFVTRISLKDYLFAYTRKEVIQMSNNIDRLFDELQLKS